MLQVRHHDILHSIQGTILKVPQIVAVAFSPSSTFLQTFQRPQKEAGNADKNLKVTMLHYLLTYLIPNTVLYALKGAQHAYSASHIVPLYFFDTSVRAATGCSP